MNHFCSNLNLAWGMHPPMPPFPLRHDVLGSEVGTRPRASVTMDSGVRIGISSNGHLAKQKLVAAEASIDSLHLNNFSAGELKTLLANCCYSHPHLALCGVCRRSFSKTVHKEVGVSLEKVLEGPGVCCSQGFRKVSLFSCGPRQVELLH